MPSHHPSRAASGPSNYGAAPSANQHDSSNGTPDWTLAIEAGIILLRLRHTVLFTRERSAAVPKSAELGIHLYALCMLHRLPAAVPSAEEGGEGIRYCVAEQARREEMGRAVVRTIEGILDAAGRVEDGMDDDDDDDGILEMLWRPWPVHGRKAACAIDLLLPPYSIPASAHLLVHPLISTALRSAWQCGLPSEVPSSTHRSLRSTYRFLRSAITPRRLHFYHLASFFVLYGLCVSLALKPGTRINPSGNDVPSGDESLATAVAPKPGPVEASLLVWIASDLGASIFHRPNLPRLLVLSPLYLVLPAAYYSPQVAFTLLTLSLPLLATLLVLPHHPSIALLTSRDPTSPSSSLSLSCLLSSTLRRLAWPFVLVMPLILGLMMLFSYAMNGDLSRGFVELSSIVTTSSRPVEQGIAPYQARLALFASICLLVFYALVVSVASTSSGLSDGSAARRGIGLSVKAKFAQAVVLGMGYPAVGSQPPPQDPDITGRSGDEESQSLLPSVETAPSYHTLGPSVCPVPLDQLFAPLDIARAIVTGAGVSGWQGADRWSRRMRDAVDWTAVLLMGPLCAILIPIEWIFNRIGRR